MKPVVVLIDGLTFSAGETLLLAMRTLPHVTVVGTKTSGSMGETYNDVLPNGWAYRTVIQRIVDPEERSWEGIGIPPDLRVANDPAEIEAGRDRALEVAMLLIGSGSQALLGRRESLQTASLTIKLPVADTLEAWIEDRGVSSAMELFNRAIGDTTQWFLAEDFVYDEDLTGVGRRLIDHGDLEAAIVVLEAARSAHPESYRPHAQLARAHDLAGDEVESAAARDRALALNTRMFSADRRIAIELHGEVPASHRFFETLFDDGAGAAIAEYRRLTTVGTARVHVDPLLLVRGGQQLREAGMTEEAHTVFQFVVEEFPSWAIGYLGLAETLRSKGQTVLALEAYHTILALDPGNVYARERIAELEPRR